MPELPMNASALERRFRYTAGGILAITGLAKAFSAFGSARALDMPDPLMGIPFRHLMLLVGLAEMFVAFLCLLTDKRGISLMAVAWLATGFLVYRCGLWLIDWHKPCGCLGDLTAALHLSPQVAENLMKTVLAYLLIGSYWNLGIRWLVARRSSTVDGLA